MRIKKHENITKVNVAKVIGLLEAEKPITKKEACSILNISYNTTRLGNIIDQHKEDLVRTMKMKAKLRGTPATDGDIKFVVQGYLQGDNVSNIAKRIYRSPAFVKNIVYFLKKLNLMRLISTLMRWKKKLLERYLNGQRYLPTKSL